MKCLFCGYEADIQRNCPNCGRDLSVYKRIQVASALCYNEGLKKAKVRDLSGAIDELSKALKFNKYNMEARNLLGLVYFEIGEPVNAMAEWVISKSLIPEDNIAGEYLEMLKGDPKTLNRMDSATKMYNQVVNYLQHGDYDLAKIQLKRLVNSNPGMIRARSLLALVYIKDGEYRAGRKELVAAGKIDVGNPTINTYFQEINRGRKSEIEKRRNSRIDASEDNLMAAQSSRLTYLMDYSKVSVVNVIIGLVLGLLVSIFLIFPAIKQAGNSDAMSALINAKEDARSAENDISAMQQTIEGLTNRLKEYEGQTDIKYSYEHLLLAEQLIAAGDMEGAKTEYLQVTREMLEPKGVEIYDQQSIVIGDYVKRTNYEDGKRAFEAEDYTVAVEKYLPVVTEEETFDEGNAIYNLAFSYEQLDKIEEALKYYNRTVEIYQERRIGRRAAERISILGGGN